MMKKLVLCLSIVFIFKSNAQTLFTYANKSVSKKEFLAAFDKNPGAEKDRKKALAEYKDLFINFKLKVQAAYDEKLNEQSTFKSESETFKKQITESYINEEANIKTLLNEAFERSQKDIDVSQIFVANGTDTVASRMQIFKAYQELLNRKNFSEVLAKYCTDKDIVNVNGNIGYITVFSLPYAIENVVYELKKGQFSFPYKSAYGWHIFTNVNDRPAVGKSKMAQILLAYPKNYTQEEKAEIDKKAEMVYEKIIKGEKYGKLAQEYSNDYATSSNNGEMGEIGLGKFNKEFEENIFSLKNNGDISKLIYTNYGVYILKLIERIPVAKTKNDDKFMEALKTNLDRNDRLATAKKSLIEKWKKLTGFRKAFYSQKAIATYIDSSLRGVKINSLLLSANDSTLLFSVGKENYKLYQFIDYVKSVRYSSNEKGNSDYPELLNMFEDVSCSEYYKNHLEEYSSNFKQQLKEFNDANLLFAAMDKHVWNKAAEDTVALKNYYITNQSKYQWQPGVAAINFSTNNLKDANEIIKKLKNNLLNWRTTIREGDLNIAVDSGRYEYQQLPNYKQSHHYTLNNFTEPFKNNNDDNYSFIYVTQIFESKEPRSFLDSRGTVMNDYQQVLEKNWLESLRKKYPVKFNVAVWKMIK